MFCPIDSKMKFDYFVDGEKVCDDYQSTILNCPSTASMSFSFKDGNCIRKIPSRKYDCIGSWNWHKKNYLIVSETSLNETQRQKFKCGVSFKARCIMPHVFLQPQFLLNFRHMNT